MHRRAGLPAWNRLRRKWSVARLESRPCRVNTPEVQSNCRARVASIGVSILVSSPSMPKSSSGVRCL